jgi:hypothetical protein
LEAIYDPWISWNSSLVRRIELKFLPKAFLIRINHPWKYQPKQAISSGTSILRGGGGASLTTVTDH